jgi:hypothetical protein
MRKLYRRKDTDEVRTYIDRKLIVKLDCGLETGDFAALWENVRCLRRWEFCAISAEDTPWTFWCVPLTTREMSQNSVQWLSDTPAWATELTASAMGLAEEVLGVKALLSRCFLNGHTYGQDGTVHQDTACREIGTYTMIYYPCLEWMTEWGGETVFFEDDRRSIHRSLSYKPNSFAMWDARVWHVGRAPARICPELRITMVWNLTVPGIVSTRDSLRSS